ncbi:hypothetical protein [Marinobacter sp.]|uniref:hypothetical protein n=1 Tax=Marinobacter sp. TaxID=50741 RepID=UPI002B271782|nr:hypothetical protein [Marinobacter sp.]
MTELQLGSGFSNAAFRAMEMGPLPPSPKERTRIGEELQPVGTYAGVIPYLGTIQDIEALQGHEGSDPEFTSKDWWWDHQKIRFLNDKLGFKFLILVVPMTWVITLWIGGPALMIWALGEMQFVAELPALVVGVFIIFFILAWFAFAVWATPITTNWLMSTGMGFVLKPFEKAINKRLDKTLEDGCSEFNRITGQVRLAGVTSIWKPGRTVRAGTRSIGGRRIILGAREPASSLRNWEKYRWKNIVSNGLRVLGQFNVTRRVNNGLSNQRTYEAGLKPKRNL